MSTLAKLQSVNVSEVVDTLHSLRGKPVDAAYAVQIGVCLLSKVDEIQSAARKWPLSSLQIMGVKSVVPFSLGDFVVTSAKDETLRSWMIRTYATALEDDRADIRRAACRAQSCLQAVEFAQELVHILELDPSPIVKAEARDTLVSFGERYLFWDTVRDSS